MAVADKLSGSEARSVAIIGDGAMTGGGTVVLVTHESFHLPKKLVRQFEEESGYQLEVRAAGDAGTLATKLSLTADNPIADAAFGSTTPSPPGRSTRVPSGRA